MVLTKQRGEGGPGCSLRTTLGCSHPLAEENNSDSTQFSLTVQFSSEKPPLSTLQQLKEYLEYRSGFFAVISFYHLNSPLPLKEIIRIWIHLVSGLGSKSPSRTNMFIKDLLFIFLLGSLPFVALAQEGKEKVWLQLFPVVSCDFPVSVLSHGLQLFCL